MTLMESNELMFPGFWDGFFDNDLLGFQNEVTADQNVPAVNVKDSADHYQIEMAAPGKKKDDFEIYIKEGMLTISSSQKSERKQLEVHYTRQEFDYRSFSRVFTLPEGIEEGEITAMYKDGILSVTLPKKEEAKTKLIKIVDVS